MENSLRQLLPVSCNYEFNANDVQTGRAKESQGRCVLRAKEGGTKAIIGSTEERQRG